MIFFKIFSIFFVASFFIRCAHAQNLQCPDIAKTLKEYSISTSSSSYLNSVFDNQCEQNGDNKATSAGFGLDAVVKAIPLKLTGNYSSNEQAIKNFCKTYASTMTSEQRSFSYEERVASKALDTIQSCLALQSQGVIITHNIVNVDQTAFFLKSGLEQKISISGIAVSPNISCHGIVASKSKPFDETSVLRVEKNQNIFCTRKTSAIPGTNTRVYEEATITVATNFGNYPVLLPRDQRLSENLASDIARKIDLLDKDVSQVSANVRPLVSSKPLTVYKCPVDRSTGPGSWASYGCVGQLSTEASCGNYVFNTGVNNLPCTPIGVMRTFDQ